MKVITNTSKVYFDKPIVLDLIVDSQGNPRPYKELTTEQINTVCNNILAVGFGERAVVVKRGELWRAKRAPYFGVVQNLYRFRAGNDVYVPLLVKWLDNTESRHWPDELFLIYPAATESEMDTKIQEQVHVELV